MGDIRVGKTRVQTTSLPLLQGPSLDAFTWRPVLPPPRTVPPTWRLPPEGSSHLPMMHCDTVIFERISAYPGWTWFNGAAVLFVIGSEWKRHGPSTLSLHCLQAHTLQVTQP